MKCVVPRTAGRATGDGQQPTSVLEASSTDVAICKIAEGGGGARAGKLLSPRNFPNLRCCDVSPMLASRCGYQVSLSPRAASLSTEQWRVSQNMYPLRKQCDVCQAAASTQRDRKALGVSYQRRCKPSAPATTTKRQNMKNSNCPSNTHNQT